MEDEREVFCGRKEGAPPGLHTLHSKSSQCDLSLHLGQIASPYTKAFLPGFGAVSLMLSEAGTGLEVAAALYLSMEQQQMCNLTLKHKF